MAFTWNPFSQFEFDEGNVVIRHPNSGYFARITGPIVELLSQLPFFRCRSRSEHLAEQNRCKRRNTEEGQRSLATIV